MVMGYQIVFMYYQEDGNGLWTISKTVIDYQGKGNGLWTISKMFMFYGLQYNEDFTKKRASLYFIYFIL